MQTSSKDSGANTKHLSIQLVYNICLSMLARWQLLTSRRLHLKTSDTLEWLRAYVFPTVLLGVTVNFICGFPSRETWMCTLNGTGYN